MQQDRTDPKGNKMAIQHRLREERGRVETEMNAITARCQREDNRGLNNREVELWNKLADAHSALCDKIEKAEAGRPRNSGNVSGLGSLEEIQDTMRLSPAAWRERRSDPHARAFSNFLRGGMEGLEADEKQLMRGKFADGAPVSFRNAQSTTTTQGGYLVPQGFSDQLMEAMKWFGGIAGTVDEFTTGTGQPLPWPTVNDTANRGRIIGQNVQTTETDVVFSQYTLNAWIFSSDLVLVPLALIEDSYFDIDALVARLLGTRLGRLFNWKMTTGQGVNAGEPNGIVTAAVAAGNLLTLPSGETTSIAYNDLVNLEHSVDPAYRYNPSTYWMFNDSVLKVLKKLVDASNRPLWQPGLTASFADGAGVQGLGGSRPMILEHPYIINNDMAVPAANAYTMLFGDMSTYKVRKVANGVTLMRLVERYADWFKRFCAAIVPTFAPAQLSPAA